MSIGLGDIYLISVFLIMQFGLIWFGSVGKIKTANETNPCG